MPRRTSEEALRTKERILTQAIEVCTVEGYDKLSLSFVAEAASVTRGAIYHHFRNKEGLFLAAVTRLLEEIGGRIEAAAEAGATPKKALESGCRTFLQASQSPAYHRIILTDAPAVLGIPTWQELDYHYTTRLLADALRELDSAGEIDVPETEAAAQALSGAMNQLSLWIASGNSFQEAEATLLRLLSSLEGPGNA